MSRSLPPTRRPVHPTRLSAARRCLASLALSLTAVLVACGGDSSTAPPPDPIVVTVSAGASAVDAGGTTTVTATVSNATNTSVTWSASGGTISGAGASATWTAPGAGGSYTITATSVADATKSASTNVTVRSVGVNVAPAAQTIGAGDTIAVSATVTNAVTEDVTWSASAGTILGTGPSVQWAAPVAGGAYTLTATSTLDPARSAQATVTVTPVVVTVTAAQATLFRGATTTLTAQVEGTGDPRVTWAATCGVLNGTGASVQYTAPETAGPCAVTATSVRDPATADTASLTIRRAWRVAALDDANDGACTFAHCSFREALIAANDAPDVDTILLLPDASSVASSLASSVASTRASSRGPSRRGVAGLAAGTLGTVTLTGALPFIDAPVEIIGPGASALTIDANASMSAPRGVLYFTGDFAAGVRGVTLRGGMRSGGAGVAIDENARVTLRDVHVRDNVSLDVAGGGVIALRGGRGTFVDVEIVGNRSTGPAGPGGGISVEPGSMIAMTGGRLAENESEASFGGGARVFNGALMLDGVTVADNRAPTTQNGLGIGGALFSDGADAVVQLVNTTVERNVAGSAAGGLSIRGGTTATISGSMIRANSALLAGGIELGDATLTVNDTEILANTTTQRGGGILIFGAGVYTHDGGRVAQNVAGANGGGGIYMQQEASIALTDVDVTDNRATSNNGGGIWAFNQSSITMTRGSLSRNTAAVVGGGLFFSVERPLTLVDVTIEDNVAPSGGGGLFLVAGADQTAGSIRGGLIAGNQVSIGGGGGIYAQSVVLTVEGTTFRGNSAAQGGGGFLGLTSGQYTFVDVIAEENRAQVGGGLGFSGALSVDITRGALRNNIATNVGGGLWKATGADLTMTGTEVIGNTATSQGGGLQLAGPGAPATLTRLVVRGNVATNASGGGITSGVPTTVTGGVFADNVAGGIGGGIFAASLGNLVLRNATFSNNRAVTGGGVAATGPAALTNVTLVGNRATDYGGGIGTNNAGAMTVTNVLLAANLVNDVPQDCGTGGSSTITSNGGNLSSSASCTMFTQGSDKPNVAPGVDAALTDNGGGTLTHALLEGSPAINAGVTASCPTTDQRGFARNGTCDIGAFEFGGQPPAASRARAVVGVRRR